MSTAGTRRRPVQMRLVSGDAAQPSAPRTWPADITALLADPGADSDRGWSPYRVRGGPGTGKSALIADLTVARLREPTVDPESVVVLVSSKAAANRLRASVSTQLIAAGHHRVGREPVVRTIHSYAFGLLRLHAATLDAPPPRLMTGSEQDAMVRELLAGDIEDGAHYWPPHLRAALGTQGFAKELRNIMMRASERGLGPEDLIEMGQRLQRPVWEAAGHFFRTYEHATLLRGSVGMTNPLASAPALDAAELVGSALEALATDRDLLDRERARVQYLFIDDAQHLDPQAAQLIRTVGSASRQCVITGDDDQAIYEFRGASPRFLDTLDVPAERDLVLRDGFRLPAAMLPVIAAIRAKLPGVRRSVLPEPVADPGDTHPTSAVRLELASSAAREANTIASALSRAHLHDGTPWSEMAIIVRSVPRVLAPLRRALRAAGIPVATPAAEMPLAQQRAVAATLLVLRAALGGEYRLGAEEIIDLLTGPFGDSDPGALRRLRRGLRRAHAADSEARPESAELLDLVVNGGERELLAGLTVVERECFGAVLAMIDAVRTAQTDRVSVEEVLWRAWVASEKADRWLALALRSDLTGDQADRDLDAMVLLFTAAASFTDSLPAATVAGFIDYLTRLRIPTESQTEQANAEAVTILSAHAAAGREWDVVVVAGVQDGLWPGARGRGGPLATDDLIDLLDGMDERALDVVSRSAVDLAAERRLFLMACSRARSRLLVTAVADGVGEHIPSRFVDEVAAVCPPVTSDTGSRPAENLTRALSLDALVAELRAEVCAPRPHKYRAAAAAEMLAELAEAGVPGAHPDQWYGLADPSTSDPTVPDGAEIRLSPSQTELLLTCPLRWMLQSVGGSRNDSRAAVHGSVVHALVQAVAEGVDEHSVSEALAEVWDSMGAAVPPWYSRGELERTRAMLDNFTAWLAQSRSRYIEIGTEVDIKAQLPAVTSIDGTPQRPVSIVGRLDRLEGTKKGEGVVIDVKTGRSPISAADAQQHLQLLTYQLALALGGHRPGGGELVFVNVPHQSTGAAVRAQDPLPPDEASAWIETVRGAAAARVGPEFAATVNAGCVHCPVADSCPADPRGRTVTDG